MAVLAPRSSVDDAPAPLPLPVFASATPLSPRPHTTSSIHELLDAKHCPQPSILYPNHGFARGGVGHLVSTGACAAACCLQRVRASMACSHIACSAPAHTHARGSALTRRPAHTLQATRAAP